MPIKYIPYTPNTIEGQAILDNITRTQRVLRYRENNEVYNRIQRGMPYYEVETVEQVGEPSENLIIRGECVSNCAYLKEQGIKVDLVYIDPPFASGVDYAKKVYIRRNPKLAEILKEAERTMEMDELRTFEEKMYGDIWQKEDFLNWMYENLQAIKTIMNDNASIYLHLDYHIGHYVKILMDEVFGEDRFLNEVIWCYSDAANSKTHWNTKHDTIFFYSKSEKYVFNYEEVLRDHSEGNIKKYKFEDEIGKYRLFGKNIQGSPIQWHRDVKPEWEKTNPELVYRHYLKSGSLPLDWWLINPVNQAAHEKQDYSTQKPEELLERIIKSSSNKGMVVADFFGGSGVTAKVANDLGRKFIHCDVGINSIQTVRDRLLSKKANFTIKEVKDGVNLFRNPQQTMDKLASLITGLQKNVDGVSNFWLGVISDSKWGTIPVYVPDLIDSKQKVLDIPTINKIINQEISNLNITAKKVIVYYIDIDDEKVLKKFIKDNNVTTVDVELRDLKNVLHETVVNDEITFTCNKVAITNENKSLFDVEDSKEVYVVEINKFVSDRLQQKINEYNEKGNLQSLKNDKVFNPIDISEEGLELIELITLDCKNSDGEWFSSTEIKIDKLGYVINNGVKSKDFWNGKIVSKEIPLRLKVRNISGDESISLV
jgi:adenine-specific DNA-methyltransferase